jgi:hypothetical protein
MKSVVDLARQDALESINFGTVPVVVVALIYIAQDQQFFAANHLSIIFPE